MKMRILLIGAMLVFPLVFSSTLNAGIYLGTDANMPANQQALEVLGTPAVPEQVTYFTEETTVIKDAIPIDCEPYNGKGPMPAVPCPLEGPPSLAVASVPIAVTVRTGSLKDNIDRITSEAGWDRMVWKPEYDYNWVGDVTITASDIQGVLTKLLEPYPLQAVFYTANHVVEIIPRRNT